jgi:hypothetical protein
MKWLTDILNSKLFSFYKYLMMLVGVGILLGWIFNLPENIHHTLITIMFINIGLIFLLGVFAFENRWKQLFFVLGGIYFIVFRFLPEFYLSSFIGLGFFIIFILLSISVNKTQKEIS